MCQFQYASRSPLARKARSHNMAWAPSMLHLAPVIVPSLCGTFRTTPVPLMVPYHVVPWPDSRRFRLTEMACQSPNSPLGPGISRRMSLRAVSVACFTAVGRGAAWLDAAEPGVATSVAVAAASRLAANPVAAARRLAVWLDMG